MLERLIYIHKRIKAGKYPNCSFLSKKLECSIPTINRDIEFLRDRFLAPIEYESDFTDCSGTRVKGEVSLLLRGCVQSVEEGEIQFTDYGLTGICVFNLSREIVIDEMTRFQDYTVKLNLLSRYKPQEIFLVLDIRRGIKDLDTKDLMMSIVNRNIAEKLLSPWIKSTEKACQLTQ